MPDTLIVFKSDFSRGTLLKKSFKIALVFLLLFLSGSMAAGCTTETPKLYEETRTMMDTFIRIAVIAKEEIAQKAINAAFTRFQEIEQIATSWDSDGEAYQLNETGYLENPSSELVEMLELSIECNELTDGYFDITVQPLLDIWKFVPDAEQQFWELDRETQQARIDEVMGLVGSDRIIIEDGSVRLLEGSEITLGGIAKGYAADKAIEIISGMGIKHALVDAGGDMKTLGLNPDGQRWNVAMVNPEDTTQFLADFYVTGMAVTTSGNYVRYFSPDKTANHILNPKTGFSTVGCVSVTVITETGAISDALSTAIMAMGLEKGMALVESLDDVEALIVDSDFTIHESSGLSNYQEQK